MRICVITDNEYIYTNFNNIISSKCKEHTFDFYYSSINNEFVHKYEGDKSFLKINIKEVDDSFVQKYDLFFSLHSKQFFPKWIVEKKRCINVHPGFNPYNRGWFPQVFSIINKKKVGVTIHEMDCKLDHGPILYQQEVKIESYDTSYDVYSKIISLEIELLELHLEDIIEGNYTAIPMKDEGNVNKKSDFDILCKLDLEKRMTVGEVIDLLRATTFEKYDNAYFIDETGNKVYVSIVLKKEE